MARPRKAPAIEIDCEIEADRKGIGVFTEFVAIEGHPGLQSQRVPGSQPTAAEAKRPARGMNGLPDGRRRGGIDHQFDTILTGVARPADGCRMAGDDGRRRPVVSQAGNAIGIGGRTEAADDLNCPWTLHGDHCRLEGAVCKRHTRRRQTALQPGDDPLTVARIDDQPHAGRAVGRIRIAGDERIVEHDRSAVGIARDQRIPDAAHLDAGYPSGEQRLQPLDRLGAAHREPPHVRDVEQAGRLPSGKMLLDDRCVLNGHQPTGEVDHPTAMRCMPADQWGFKKCRRHVVLPGRRGQGQRGEL